jgi:hypothetical protein
MRVNRHKIIKTLDHVAETLEARGSRLARDVDTVSEAVMEDLYEELERAGFDDFPTRDTEVALEVHDENPSLIPDPTYVK